MLKEYHQPGHQCVEDLSPFVCENGCFLRSLVFMSSHLYSFNISVKTEIQEPGLGGKKDIF